MKWECSVTYSEDHEAQKPPYLVRVNGIEILNHVQHTLRHLFHGEERLIVIAPSLHKPEKQSISRPQRF